jgi:hypothetical protein
MGEAAQIEDRLARKSDLDDAKTDLRREMRLWIAVWVGAGTFFGNVASKVLTGDVAEPTRSALALVGITL